jgi:hypothetical protein
MVSTHQGGVRDAHLPWPSLPKHFRCETPRAKDVNVDGVFQNDEPDAEDKLLEPPLIADGVAPPRPHPFDADQIRHHRSDAFGAHVQVRCFSVRTSLSSTTN